MPAIRSVAPETIIQELESCILKTQRALADAPECTDDDMSANRGGFQLVH